jgi:prepilin-type N-terminal cleavage/methylation domain-containing protein
MNNRGITLIELLVVVTIIGILVVALGFEFSGWMGRYRIESQVKEMYVDLMNARTRAMQRNRAHIADFPTADSYRVREDTNEDFNPAVLAGDTILPSFPKTVQYDIIGAVELSFDASGLVYSGAPPVLIDSLVPVVINLTLPPDVTPDYDCIELGPTRINMGLMTGGACVAR